MADIDTTQSLQFENLPGTAEVPSLKLDPETKSETEQDILNGISLSPQEMKAVDDFSEKIDIKNTRLIMQYGARAQEKIADFLDTVLQNLHAEDLEAAADEMKQLTDMLNSFDSEKDDTGFSGWFKDEDEKAEDLKRKYEKVRDRAEKIGDSLKEHQSRLLDDIVVLDKFYDANLAYHKELTMYVAAGRKKLSLERATVLADLKEKAAKTGLLEDSQAANDYAQKCDGFEKRLYDLELTRTVSLQNGQKLRIIQSKDRAMVDKIQTAVSNTIPLWKIGNSD